MVLYVALMYSRKHWQDKILMNSGEKLAEWPNDGKRILNSHKFVGGKPIFSAIQYMSSEL